MTTLAQALLLTAGSLVPATEANDPLALVGGRLYAGPESAPIEDSVVLIAGGMIRAAGPRASIEVPRDARVVDVRGQVVTAGFWNCHVHFTQKRWADAATRGAGELEHDLAEMLVRHGFTTVVDTGSFAPTFALRERIRSGEVRGPTILTVGVPIYPPGGAPDLKAAGALGIDVMEVPDGMPEVVDIETARALVTRNLDAGADGTKAFAASWSAAEGSFVTMPPEMLEAVTKEAHARKKPVFVHPQTRAGLENAIDCGIDVLVHTAPDSGTWESALLDRMKGKQIALVPTLKLWPYEAQREGLPPDVADEFIANGIAQLAAYFQAGGQILFGTDVGYMLDDDPSEEYTLMHEAGLEFRDILATLTVNPAQKMGWEKSGRVSEGMSADLVVLSADPQQDLSALTRIRLVIRAGKIIWDAALSDGR